MTNADKIIRDRINSMSTEELVELLDIAAKFFEKIAACPNRKNSELGSAGESYG